MTNAEKLAQDPELITEMIFSYCEKRDHCVGCPFDKTCNKHLQTHKNAVEWLKQEAEE